MNFMELAKTRYSVRKFDDRPIEKETLDLILEAGNVAPTGCNYQPQRIYVVQSEEKIAKLNELSRCIFGAKTVLLFTYNKDEDWKNPLENGVHSGVQDVSIVATHIMLEAWELGVGTCWVNYFANSRLEKELGLPENECAVLLMPMGYPAEDSVPLKLHDELKNIDETVKLI
ncbi:MAG: nitroreductase family protein [Ruminococcus sp.]|nr:nitroreductase family protein [Ruminococcus sp.]MDE7137632.1 nitroreductase family protein [Ruminococcus sp.]